MVDKNLVNYFLIMALAHWAVYLVATAIKGIVTGLHYLQDRFNETEIGKRLEIDDRLTKYLSDAVEGMAPLADDLKEAASDGKLTDAEKENLANKAWQMFKGRALPKDWLDFGSILLPGYKPSQGISAVEEAVRKQFEARLPAIVEANKKDDAAAVRGALPAQDPLVNVNVEAGAGSASVTSTPRGNLLKAALSFADPETATLSYAQGLAGILALNPGDASDVTFLQFQAAAFNRAFLLLQQKGSSLNSGELNTLGDLATKAWIAWTDFKSTRTSGNMAAAEELISSVVDILRKGK